MFTYHSSTKRESFLFVNRFFTQAKVGQIYVSTTVKENATKRKMNRSKDKDEK